MNRFSLRHSWILCSVLLLGTRPSSAQITVPPIGKTSVVAEAPESDVYEEVNAAVPKNGKIAYTGSAPLPADENSDYWDQYAVVRDFTLGNASPIRTLRVQVLRPQLLYAPKLSPDGRKLMFKVGDIYNPENHGYVLYIWDLDLGIVQVGPDTVLQEREVRWSNDNSKISYFKSTDPMIAGSTSGQKDLYNFDLKANKAERLRQSILPEFEWLKSGSQVFADNAFSRSEGTYFPSLKTFSIFKRTPLNGGAQVKTLIPNATNLLLSPDKNFILFNQVSPASGTIGDVGLFNLQSGKILDVPNEYKDKQKVRIDLLPERKAVVLKHLDADSVIVDWWDLASNKNHSVLQLTAKNLEPAPIRPKFKILPQVGSSSTCIVQIQTFGMRQANNLRDSFVSLKQVQSDKHEGIELAKFKNAIGIDSWRLVADWP